jgi:UDP:flavonoid glycosyltransferase YjiC (YdhE family)
MRVLFTAVPYWGHVTPMLPLARAFADAGAEVVWATGEPAAGRLRAAGFTAVVAGVPEAAAVSPLLLATDPELAALPARERPDLMFGRIFGRHRSAPMIADLLPIVRSMEPDLVVRDMAEFASPIAAAAAGVPCLTHSLGALLPVRRIAAAGADVAPLWKAQGLRPRPYGGSYDELYLDIYPPSLQDQSRPHVPHSVRLRSVPPSAAGCAPHPRPESRDRTLVYVTFGTIFNDSEPLRRVVEGVRDLDVSVVVTVGPDGDPGVLGPQPENVVVRRFIPQDDLLPHCAAVVSHGGSGTFLGAAAYGLPQVCVPQGADQFLNADACARGGIGLSVPADPGQVRQALERVLTDPGYGIAAWRLKAELDAMPTAAEVAALLIDRYGQRPAGRPVAGTAAGR